MTGTGKEQGRRRLGVTKSNFKNNANFRWKIKHSHCRTLDMARRSTPGHLGCGASGGGSAGSLTQREEMLEKAAWIDIRANLMRCVAVPREPVCAPLRLSF